MDWLSALVVYFLLWWLCLFLVLPWGLEKSARAPQEGLAAAPVRPKLKQKFLITTGLSFALWLIVFFLIKADFIDFREIAAGMDAGS